jgi:c-di-GMP-binding flagellar brake protein YcgR
METVTATSIAPKKVAARAAVIGLDDGAGKLLGECFREFHIEVLHLESAEVQQRLHKEKFEAIVLRLEPKTEALIQSARNSPSNKRAVIYGIAANAHDAMQYSRFGINAIFEAKWLEQPLDQQSVLKVVQATHQLVARQLRRYVRVPVVTEVTAQAGAQRFIAYTQEISAGGMSIVAAPRLNVGQLLQLSFALPNGARVNVTANICWVREANGSTGVRFDPSDERRNVVRDWIEQYLEFS